MVRVNHTINEIKHNCTKEMILISVLYQNASTSQILEASPQGLISSYRIRKSCTLISTLKLGYKFLVGSDLLKMIHCATYV